MTPTKTISPEEIAKKLNEAKPEERAAILTQIASEHGAAPVAAPAPVITFSPEEQKRLVDGIVNQSAKLIGDKAAEVSREYKLPHGEAVAMVEDAASRSAKERNLKRQKYGIIAKRLATSLRPNGIGSDDYKRAAEEEAEFLKKNYGMDRAERAMSLADDTKGGALAPEVMETEVYFHVQQTAIGRRYCEVKEIPLGQEIKKWPKITSDMSAAVKAEAAAGNESDIDTTTFDLNPKAIIALSGPISIDLILASSMNIVEHLISRAAFVFSKQEDRYLFNGDSGVNWNGLLTDVPSGQVVEMAAGEAITDLNPDYLIDMEYKLEDHYIPDPEDVTGSRVTTGEALNWFHRAAYQALKKSKTGSGEYNFAVQEMMRDKRINGNRFRRVPYLPSAPALDERFGLFGNLKYTWVGVRPGIMIDLTSEAIVGGVNLFKTGQRALRMMEWWDYALVDNGSLSAIKRNAA